MNKITLKEFINKPIQAIEDGYYPDFMSVGSLVANAINMEMIEYFYDELTDLLLNPVKELPKRTITFIADGAALLSILFLFPIWWIAIYFAYQHLYKKARKNEQSNQQS